MTNIERLAQEIIKTGAKNIIIHSIPGTNLWLTLEKIDDFQWSVWLFNPDKTAKYNLGIVNNEEHLKLWRILITREIKRRISLIKLAEELKVVIKNFLVYNTRQEYKNLLKYYEQSGKNKKGKRKKKHENNRQTGRYGSS